MEESHKRITKEISTRQRTATLSARVEAVGVPVMYIYIYLFFFFTNMLNIKHHFDFRFDLNQLRKHIYYYFLKDHKISRINEIKTGT